jgi:hypothetical protein
MCASCVLLAGLRFDDKTPHTPTFMRAFQKVPAQEQEFYRRRLIRAFDAMCKHEHVPHNVGGMCLVAVHLPSVATSACIVEPAADNIWIALLRIVLSCLPRLDIDCSRFVVVKFRCRMHADANEGKHAWLTPYLDEATREMQEQANYDRLK